MVNRLRPCYHCYDHRSPWDLHHFLHHEFNFTPLYKKDSGTRITIKKVISVYTCTLTLLSLRLSIAVLKPFNHSRGFCDPECISNCLPVTEILLGVEKVGFKERGRGEEGRSYNGNIYDTYWITYSVAFQLLYRRQNISSWLAQISYALILKELNMSRYGPMKIILVK